MNTDAASAIRGLGSPLERAFDSQVRSLAPDLPRAKPGYAFAPDRNWRFDRAWPDYRVAVELEGGIFGSKVVCHNCGAVVLTRNGREVRQGGGHQHVGRFAADKEKYNAAGLAGWMLLRFTHEDVHGDPWKMVEAIRRALENRAWRIRQVESLTPGQDTLLHFIAGGTRLADIALRLGLTEAAVKKQSESLKARLLATNRPAAVARGFAWGLIDPDRIPWEWEKFEVGIATGTYAPYLYAEAG